jgi:small subunit ribosomal protein S20
VANHVSSEKRARQAEARRTHNRQYLSSVRTAVKKFRFAINGLEAGTMTDAKKLQELFVEAQSMLSRAAAKGMIHSNNAARKIARLAQLWKTTSERPAGGDNMSRPKAKSKAGAGKKAAAAKTAEAAPKKTTAAAPKKAAPKKTTAKSKK